MAAHSRWWLCGGVCVLGLVSLDCAVPWYPAPEPYVPYEPSVLRVERHLRTQAVSWSADGLGPHGGTVGVVEFSPDGRLLITADQHKPVLVWSMAERRLVQSLPHADAVRGLEHHPQQAVLVAAGEQGLWTWDLGTGRQRPMTEQQRLNATCLALSDDGSQVVTGTAWGHLFVWHVATGARQIELRRAHAGYINAVAYNAHRPLLASAGTDGVARIWHAGDGREIAVIDTKRDQVCDVAWSLDGSRLALAIGDVNVPGVWIWNADSRAVEHRHSTRYAWADALSWSPDGEHLAVARGKRLEIWRAADGSMVHQIEESERDLAAVHWSGARSTIAYGGDDGWVRLAPWSSP